VIAQKSSSIWAGLQPRCLVWADRVSARGYAATRVRAIPGPIGARGWSSLDSSDGLLRGARSNGTTSTTRHCSAPVGQIALRIRCNSNRTLIVEIVMHSASNPSMGL